MSSRAPKSRAGFEHGKQLDRRPVRQLGWRAVTRDGPECCRVVAPDARRRYFTRIRSRRDVHLPSSGLSILIERTVALCTRRPWAVIALALALTLTGLYVTVTRFAINTNTERLISAARYTTLYELLSCGAPCRRMGWGGRPAMMSRHQSMASLWASRRIFLSRSKPARKID